MNVASSDKRNHDRDDRGGAEVAEKSSSTNVTSIAPSARFLNTVCSVVSISQVRS